MMRTLPAVLILIASAKAAGPGLFDAQGDVGSPSKKGVVEYNAAAGEYRITGGGANVWAAADSFYFVWKRVSGNFALSADIRFEGASAAGHRKAMLMVRQGPETDAAYADVALHGDGLTSLQFRPTAGATTQEMRSTVNGPVHDRIERRGDQFTISAAKAGEEGISSGPATVDFKGQVYVGLAVCSHNDEALETAVFSHVKIEK